MNNSCKECPDRGSEDCALPSLVERASDALSFIGKQMIVGVATGSAFHAVQYSQEYGDRTRVARDVVIEQRDQRIADCKDGHQAVPLPDILGSYNI
jgi:hypothetical protein